MQGRYGVKIYCFLADSGTVKYFKFGITQMNDRGCSARLKACQTGCPFPLVLYAYDSIGLGLGNKTPFMTEKCIHHLLHEYRTQGEWFTGPEVEAFANRMKKNPREAIEHAHEAGPWAYIKREQKRLAA